MRKFTLLPYLFGILALGLIGWTGFRSISRPTLGLYWEYGSGEVYEIQGDNPSVAAIHVGDRLISGDGVASDLVYKLIGQVKADSILLELERSGTVYTVHAQLIRPDFITIISRLSLILIGFSFWLTGALIYTFAQDRKQALLFLLFSHSVAVILAAGSISSFGPDWTQVLLYTGIIWCGFFTLRLHLDFPAHLGFAQRKALLRFLVLIAGIQTVLYFGDHFGFAPVVDLHVLGLVILGVFALEMMAVVMTIGKSFVHALTASERRRSGAVILSATFGILPVLFFSVVPEILIGRTLVPYELSFLSLLFFPLGYGYAVLRLKMVHLDSTIHRGAALAFVVLLMAGVYVFAYSLLTHFVPDMFDRYPFTGMAITILLAAVTQALYRRLSFWINRMLYGEWLDYRSAVNLIHKNLPAAETENQAIVANFSQILIKALQLDFVAVVLQDHSFLLAEANCDSRILPIQDKIFEKFWSVLSDCKSKDGCFSQAQLETVLPGSLMAKIQLVTTFQSQNQIAGILILSYKRGGGVFEQGDLDVLDVAIDQVQINLDKAQLLRDLREYSDEVGQLHHQVLVLRERERKKVAHELHDQVIQAIVGCNFRLSEMHRRSSCLDKEEIQVVKDGLSEIIGEIRQICANLRPPVLDSLDLASAFLEKIEEVKQQSQFDIRFFPHRNGERDIPEPAQTFAYRLLQESLANIGKHANAHSVNVYLSITSKEVTVVIEDDGVGLSIPLQWQQLEKEQHFGLISLREDARALKGTLEIKSSPGEGCSLMATIPID